MINKKLDQSMNKEDLKKKFEKGLLEFNQGSFHKALQKFETVIIFKKNESKILSLISICYHNLHNFNEANKFISLAISNSPKEIGYYLNKGNMLVDQKKFLEAEKFYKSTLFKFKESYLLYYNMGVLPSKHHNYKEAGIYYKNLI